MRNANWPKTGAILWIVQQSEERGLTPFGSNPNSEIYHFAHHLLCENSPRSQALLEAKTHPDFYLIKPAEENHAIKVDQLRDLIAWNQSKPQIASRKIAIIYPAEAMNIQAANALLKTLEEVALDTLFILVTLRPNSLPATILSRCFMIRANDNTLENLQQDLQSSLQKNQTINTENNTHLIKARVVKDLQLLKNKQQEPVTLAAVWLKEDVNQLCYWFIVYLSEQIHSFTRAGKSSLTKNLFVFLDKLYEARKSFLEHPELNKQLILESLLIHYAALKN